MINKDSQTFRYNKNSNTVKNSSRKSGSFQKHTKAEYNKIRSVKIVAFSQLDS